MMTRAAHGVSSAHRERGGLRRLDFFLDRVEAWTGSQPSSAVEILIVGWGNGAIALPLASQGYRVTLLEADEQRVASARQAGEDHQVSIECLHGSVSEVGHRSFHIIIVEDDVIEKDILAALRVFLQPGGRLLLRLRSPWSRSWKHLQRELHRIGWRLSVAEVATTPLSSLIVLAERWGLKRGSMWFRRVDAIDDRFSRLTSLRRATVRLLEMERSDPGVPLVMHLMPTLGMGGTERLVLDLALRLPRNGFQVCVVAMMGGGALESVFREHRLPFKILPRQGLLRLLMLRDLSRLLFLQQPAVVHTHLFGADAWGRLAAFWQRIPVVMMTEHNVNPSYGIVKRLVNRLFAKKTDALIAISSQVAQVMDRKDGVSRDKIRLIPNGIDVTRVLPRGSHPFHDLPRLITVGRLEPQKDHATLLKALALVKRPWRLKVVGSGSEEASLRALADRLGIAARIEWLGVRQDVPDLLAESDLFCFPSRWEGFGLAVLEAAAAGVPVLASDIKPLHDIFENSEVEFVLPGDVPAWSDAVTRILDDSTSAVVKATRAVPRLQAEGSVDRMVAEYVKLYRGFLHHRGSRSI